MENLDIASTQSSPSIVTDKENGKIDIVGKSYPENTTEFYTPFINFLEYFFENRPSKQLIINIEIIYLNSSSSKMLFDIFDILDENKDVCDITVNWIYDPEDEASYETGCEYKEDFENIKIELCKK